MTPPQPSSQTLRERLLKLADEPFAPPAVVALLREAEAALAAQEASPQTDLAREWQPIETAPKMRKVIVHYVNALGKHRCVMACYYKAHSLEMSDDYSEVGEYNEATGESFAPEGWYEEHDQDHPLMPLSDEPDSWMPLPKPPDVAYLAACRQEQP